jgi:MFS family permease
MDKQKRDAWVVMGALVLNNLLVSGPGAAQAGVFMTPLIHAFGWSHAEVSRITFATTMTSGLAAPLVGWLVDRIGARIVMSSGLVVAGCAYWLASYCHSIDSMMLAFALFGLGMMLGGILPGIVVAVNWFGGRRGFAGGIIFIAVGVGMSATPPVLTWLIAHQGWRMAMRWMSAPAFLIVLPVMLAVMRTRPPMADAGNAREELSRLPGVEFWPALCTAAFWLILVGDMIYSSAFQSVVIHTITYLIGIGYTAQHSAMIFSAQTLLSAVGAITWGIMADRYGVRRMLCLGMLSVALGVVSLSLIGASHFNPATVVFYVVLWGFSAGAPLPLLPILLAETIGLRRLGSLSGVVRFSAAMSAAVGPLWSGHVFDATGSYAPAFHLAALMMVVALAMVWMVRKLEGADIVPSVQEPVLQAQTS